jgi:hypothetical protein
MIRENIVRDSLAADPAERGFALGALLKKIVNMAYIINFSTYLLIQI